MYNTLSLVKETRDNLLVRALATPNLKLEVSAKLIYELLAELMAHPFVLESTCNECENIQNSIDNLCESIK